MVDWNIRASEVDTWMTNLGLSNTLCYIRGYSDVPITNQKTKDFPIDYIYFTFLIFSSREGLIFW